MSPIEWIEEDLHEIASIAPNATTIQLLSANPLALSFEKLEPILVMINKYLPKMEYIYACTRITDVRNKTVEELKKMCELGVGEISLGVESGDDWTLDRINKGYHASDIIEQCKPMLVGTGGLTLFPGTPLLEEAQRGEFTPLSATENRRCNTKNTIRRTPYQSADIRRLIWHIFWKPKIIFICCISDKCIFIRRFHIRSHLYR